MGACFNGHLNVVKFLLLQEFDMYVPNIHGRTGFHLACLGGNLNVVQLLLQEGFDMNLCTSLGQTGFHAACFCGNLNVVQFLLRRGFDMNVSDTNGHTGFHFACIGGKFNAFLIEVGFCQPDLLGPNDCHGNLHIVQFLLQQGFDMNIGNNNGVTGFHTACTNGNLNVVEFLFQQGLDMNTGSNSGATGFIYACRAGNLNIIWFLLHHEFTNIDEFCFDGTGLDILIDNRCDYSNDELYMPCVLLLIEADGEVSEEYDVFEELISAIQNRIFEITCLKKTIDKKWTQRIAQLITDFTMEPFTDRSLQNLSKFLDHYHQPTSTICSLF